MRTHRPAVRRDRAIPSVYLGAGVVAAALGLALVLAALMPLTYPQRAGARGSAQLLTAQDLGSLDRPPADHRIAYGTDPMQFGELRVPAGSGLHPLAVVIHGGCWRNQFGLDHLSGFNAALTRAGVATWSIEYRRLGNRGGGWPGTFQDVAAAMEHSRELARRFPLDLRRVLLVGHSAGGHLALWAAGRAKLPPTSPIRGRDPLSVRLVVALAPVPDLDQAAEQAICGDSILQLMGGSPGDRPDRYREGSPRQLLPLRVPQHLIAGARDQIVPPASAEAYASAARAAGDTVDLTVIEDAGHFEMISPRTPAYGETERIIRDALQRMTP